jgi:hypothetical protein
VFGFPIRKEVLQWLLVKLSQLEKFQQIDSAFPSLAFGKKRVRPADAG